MSAIIKIEDLHYTYPGDEAETLKGIDLEIEEGSFVAVLGHNGSGKSTLAKHLNAILLPTEGRVLVDGVDTADEARVLDIRRTVDMVCLKNFLTMLTLGSDWDSLTCLTAAFPPHKKNTTMH